MGRRRGISPWPTALTATFISHHLQRIGAGERIHRGSAATGTATAMPTSIADQTGTGHRARLGPTRREPEGRASTRRKPGSRPGASGAASRDHLRTQRPTTTCDGTGSPV